MKKILSFVKRVIALSVFVPIAALAQFRPPADTNLPSAPIFEIIRKLMLWALGILGFIAVIGFVISGIMYLVAAGDEKSQEKAKKAMYYSITGVIVGLVGLVVIFAVQRLLGAQTAQF